MEEFSEAIKQHESANDGMDIHLYFNSQIGFYTAYGMSAFLADHIVDGIKAYSDWFQMPVMIIIPNEVISLRNATTKVEHIPHQYYHFRLRNDYIKKEGYTKWLNQIIKKKA